MTKTLNTCLIFLSISLYTKSVVASSPPTGLPCQKRSVLGKPHLVCWTFDDHPSTGTMGILKVLRKENIRATFFVVGWALRLYSLYPKDKMVKRYYVWFKAIQNGGHLIGNHGLTHKKLCKMPKREVYRELLYTQRYIKRFGNVTPTLWRAPYLYRCWKTVRASRKLKLTHVTCHVQDYRRSARYMWKILRRRVKRGKKYSIVLMHQDVRKLTQFLRLLQKHR